LQHDENWSGWKRIAAEPLKLVDELNVPLIDDEVTNGAQKALPHVKLPLTIEQVVFVVVVPVPKQVCPIVQLVIWLEPLTVTENGRPPDVVPVYVPADGVTLPPPEIEIDPDRVH